ncbi:phage tail tape measure protein [Neisseria mucosa]|uniref:Phage tail tape measure protein n=1 Tax=Neisseria mucosa TaxID=488 RepID=A0AAW6ZE82_NEIMU|nr:phage tail tape measure protein [Neisseria mucosa]MDK6726630.1 phage tail tape measure protein [Neisseria mucosa]MDK6871038.1 phage tail tape measure protein [Neisseria mucosa]MDK8110680.1 phage tail tape measure protein [Neisseria mucosa]MDK8361934.1 phage tail tape measure protein [Neisseria mucosa]
MASGFSLGITIGASVGGAVAGIKSVKSSLDVLDKTVKGLAAQQSLLGETLQNPLRMSRKRVGELKREYDQLGQTIAKINRKRSLVADLQQQKQAHYDRRRAIKDEFWGAAGAVAGVAFPVKLAVEFESAMADVKKVVDFDTPKQFKEMEQDILRLTRTIPMAGTELAKITASGGQLGVARKDLPKFTETIAKMSVAFDMAADQAGDSMAKLANVYQIPIDQIGKLGDAVNHLSNSSPAKAGDIINTLGRVGGVAKQFGLTEIQTTSLSNAFISLGKTPEIAGTAINGMLTKLMTADKQGSKFQKALKNMGMESKDLKKAIKENGEQALMDFLKQVGKLPKENQMGALVDLFGLEYADDVAVLVSGLETYKKSIDELKKTSKDGKPAFIGSMDKEFAARSATTANNWQIFKNSLTEIGITAGSVLLPALNQLMTTIRPIINSFADWASKNPEVVSALVHLAAGFAALKVGGLMFRFVGNELSGLMVSFRLAKALLGVDWLATVIRFKSGIGALARVFGVVKTAATLLGSGLMSLGRFLLMSPIGIALALLGVAAYMLYKNWDGVVGGAKALWQDLSNFISGVVNSIASFFGTCWERIKAFFNSGIGNISAQIINWSPLGLFYQSFASVMSWFGVQLPSSFTQFGANIIQGLWNGLKSKFEAVKAWFTEKAASLKQTFAGVMGIHSPSRVFRRFGGWMMDGLQIGLDRGAASPIASMAGVAGRLKSGFANHMGQMAARVSSGRAAFADARSSQSTGGMTINYNPTINAPGGNPQQIEAALQIGLREFEAMFRRMMDDKARRAY